uniref:Uncharacterized protein n=1 Tax=Candidatus Kentrum sp. FM TaxID=2126340 RepID=A0A450S1S9_9GAMM|nr:MAG: hypothetical protein BECKFM1743A_GA0114220_1001112 [Candidatus Kentron sp. FM]VFJ45594.1 MAG: hypothetical protein BECKFM1743C_GA0114222_1002713 [Candidatus Kentron sp. FM]VFK06941.1 MAG: hypothetical protein BECKFM1743B_GA0114221_100285 [Candidatus Kentron sp. FM]
MNFGSTMTRSNSILKRITLDWHLNHATARIFHGFLNGSRNLSRFSSTETYLTFPITDYR